MKFKSVISALQTCGGNPRGPNSYMANVRGPLGTLQAKLDWQLTHLCRFHQIMYANLKERDAEIGRQHEELKKPSEAAKAASDEEAEDHAIGASRIRMAIRDADDEVEKTKNLADHFTVIGLWATVEQYLGKVYVPLAAHVNRVVAASVNAPYRWDDFRAGFRGLGIDLTALHGFPDADECRVLNNTIKHTGFVDTRLGQIVFFAPHRGKDLSEVEFEMQRYVNGVTHFVGSLIERASKIIDPTFRT
jgi:hypothetical protein